MIFRCFNWDENPQLCGATCAVEVAEGQRWQDAVLEAEWFITVRGRAGHRHTELYCAAACFFDRCQRQAEATGQPGLPERLRPPPPEVAS